jgi:hypothetical protein
MGGEMDEEGRTLRRAQDKRGGRLRVKQWRTGRRVRRFPDRDKPVGVDRRYTGGWWGGIFSKILI